MVYHSCEKWGIFPQLAWYCIYPAICCEGRNRKPWQEILQDSSSSALGWWWGPTIPSVLTTTGNEKCGEKFCLTTSQPEPRTNFGTQTAVKTLKSLWKKMTRWEESWLKWIRENQVKHKDQSVTMMWSPGVSILTPTTISIVILQMSCGQVGHKPHIVHIRPRTKSNLLTKAEQSET